ncbi:MAG: DNA polymerase II [Acidobacteria bacterium]|nr:DNA polymerase II [Acidobacteriota bacterium]
MGVNLSFRGLVLQATYRLREGLPVVYLSGCLEDGRTFLVKDDRLRPYFYIRRCDGDLVRRREGLSPQPSTMRVLRSDEPTMKVEVTTPAEVTALRKRLHACGLPTFEADIPFATRFLLDHGIRSGVEIRGAPSAGRAPSGGGFDLIFDNPELENAPARPLPSVLSLDIETDPRAQRLLSAALAGCGAAEVLLLTPPGESCPPGAIPFSSEQELLDGLCRRILELDPDVLTGWNVVGFDLQVLDRVARRHRRRLSLGRGVGPLTLRPLRGRGPRLKATLPGRLVLDGLELLRGAFVTLDSYSLDSVARHFLGEGKRPISAPGTNHAEEILRRFQEDREAFVDYNLTDARLVLDILDHLQLIELTVERSLLTGLPMDQVSRSVAAFDFLYLSGLRRRGLVAPSLDSSSAPAGAGGGHVLTPEPGLFENVLVLDFQSLYPSIIRTFQIDPAGWVPRPRPDEDLIVAPNGAAFRREPGILPALLDELFPRREAAKAAGDAIGSQAIKILMNSFYGVLGASGCRFHDEALANAITSFGREMLLWSKDRIEGYGYRVLYGDTDSLFVQLPEAISAPLAEGRQLVERLNDDIRTRIRDHWHLDSRLNLQLERHYLRLLLPSLRGNAGGARKRYAGLVEKDGGKQVIFVGLEAVRSDWTELAREVQRELYRRLFLDEPVEGYLRRIVHELRLGHHDAKLVYRKSLRKPLAAYTSTSPPHVVAARRMATRPGRRIAYVITLEGPQPATAATVSLDHEHYVDRQIRPIAEPVLEILGLDFRKVVGDDRQLELF